MISTNSLLHLPLLTLPYAPPTTSPTVQPFTSLPYSKFLPLLLKTYQIQIAKAVLGSP